MFKTGDFKAQKQVSSADVFLPSRPQSPFYQQKLRELDFVSRETRFSVLTADKASNSRDCDVKLYLTVHTHPADTCSLIRSFAPELLVMAH